MWAENACICIYKEGTQARHTSGREWGFSCGRGGVKMCDNMLERGSIARARERFLNLFIYEQRRFATRGLYIVRARRCCFIRGHCASARRCKTARYYAIVLSSVVVLCGSFKTLRENG